MIYIYNMCIIVFHMLVCLFSVCLYFCWIILSVCLYFCWIIPSVCLYFCWIVSLPACISVDSSLSLLVFLSERLSVWLFAYIWLSLTSSCSSTALSLICRLQPLPWPEVTCENHGSNKVRADVFWYRYSIIHSGCQDNAYQNSCLGLLLSRNQRSRCQWIIFQVMLLISGIFYTWN